MILAGAYYLAVKIIDPTTAMLVFFLAVVMVIIATYLLFIAGSVALCKLLQRAKSIIIRQRHFVSLSQMVYRMKRNGQVWRRSVFYLRWCFDDLVYDVYLCRYGIIDQKPLST